MPRVTIYAAVIVIEDGDEQAPAKPVQPEPASPMEAIFRLSEKLKAEMRHGRDCSPFFSTQN